jgi:hypothetical protein
MDKCMIGFDFMSMAEGDQTGAVPSEDKQGTLYVRGNTTKGDTAHLTC